LLLEEQNDEPGLMQRYDYEPVGSRFIDQWWPIGDATRMIAQSVRCYTPVMEQISEPVILSAAKNLQ